MNFRILGPIELSDAERRIATGGPAQRALLAFLLLHANQGVSADRLIEALWSEQGAAGAVKRLQVAITRLRKVLECAGGSGEPALRTMAGGYLLAVAPGELDAEVFERLLLEGRQELDGHQPARAAEILREAIALWRGPALADVAYREFAQAEIRRLEELRLAAVEARVEADLRLGRHAAVVAELEALLAASPTREGLAGQLMVALYRCGRQTDALEVYRGTREVLVDELGLEPGPLLHDLHAGVLAHDPALRPPTGVGAGELVVPAAPARLPLIGRAAELAAVCGLVRDEARLVTLTGPAGVGKTRLALAVGGRLRSSFTDGVFMIELAPIDDAQLVAFTAAQALGVVSQGSETPAAALERHLRERDVLLILDNFEHVLAAAGLLVDLLDAAPGVRLLVTSRAALNLLAEQQYEVRPLSLPCRAEAPDASAPVESDAVTLFVERARAVDRTFSLTTVNTPAVAAICTRLDGLPLALELAAGWTKLLAPPALLERLESRLELLKGGPRDLPLRQQGLRAAIDWSYRQLGADVQRLFSRAGVFAGAWTVEAAEAICDEDDLDVLGALVTLLDHSLVQVRDSDAGERRFVMLETLREYALERLVAGGEIERVRQRHAEYFRALTEAAEPHLWGPQQQAWLGRLEADHDNLRAALGWGSRSSEPELALGIAAAAAHFWWIRGYLSEGRMWLEQTLAASADAAPVLRVKALRGLSILARLQDDHVCSRHHAEEALGLSRQVADVRGIVRALSELGTLACVEGELERAATLHDESIALARELGGEDLAISVTNRADLALNQGDYARALELSEEGLDLFSALGSDEGVAISLHNWAFAALRQRRFADARRRFLESLALSERLDYKQYMATALEGVAAVSAAEGDPGGATRLLAAADRLCRESTASRDPAELDGSLRTVAHVRGALGDEAFGAEWERGQAMTRAQTFDEAHTTRPTPRAGPWEG